MKSPQSILVNGEPRQVDADADMPLLWVLRDRLGLKGTKYGCGVGLCGACLVLIDGELNHACMVALKRVGKRAVTTIEGLAAEDPRGLLRAWIAGQVPQCGYCQPAQLIAAQSLLAKRQGVPTSADCADEMDGVLCRCGTYQRIREAIGSAASPLAETHEASATPPEILVAEPLGVPLNEWITIEADNTAVLTINHSEMGQGALNSLAMLLAEELELGFEQIRLASAPADRKYANPSFGIQLTGGSTSIRGEWQRLRLAGARAREKLVLAAMKRWRVGRDTCRAEHGAVVHAATGRKLLYSELASAATRQRAPKDLRLKPASEFKLIGRASRRPDIALMCRGEAKYGIDIERPGMQVALIARAPSVGAKLRDFDAAKALETSGVVNVVAVESGVAVVGKDFWAASQGRDRLEARWDAGTAPGLDTSAIYAALEQRLENKGYVARRRGAAVRALATAARQIEARYRTPYLAHFPIEPPNCVADVRADGCEIWVGTQDQTKTQETAARIAGLPKSKVLVHTTFLGGSFGRRLEVDFVAEAVELSAKLGRPVQVVWTREDDLKHDLYRPAHCAWLKGGIDRKGQPHLWWQRIAGPSMALNLNEVAYTVANLRIEHVETRSPLPLGAWRGVGAVQNAFCVESFIDELAHLAGRDPLEYRLAALESSPRHRAVLELAAREAGWGRRLPRGSGRGIAVYRGFGSWIAQVAEVSRDADDRHSGRAHRLRNRLRASRQPRYRARADRGRRSHGSLRRTAGGGPRREWTHRAAKPWRLPDSRVLANAARRCAYCPEQCRPWRRRRAWCDGRGARHRERALRRDGQAAALVAAQVLSARRDVGHGLA